MTRPTTAWSAWFSAALLLCGHGLAHAMEVTELAEVADVMTASGVIATSTAGNSRQPRPGRVWLAASDESLSRIRGGFDLGSGLVVSFGISRAVYVNGQLSTSTLFQVSDLNRLNATQTATFSQLAGTKALVVSNGPGNALEAAAATVPFATYIQNTLNNQTIRNETVIQASSNGLGLIKNLNLQQSISDAITRAVGQR